MKLLLKQNSVFTWNTIQRCNEQARPSFYEYVAIFCEMEMFKVAALITLLNWLHFVANKKSEFEYFLPFYEP